MALTLEEVTLQAMDKSKNEKTFRFVSNKEKRKERQAALWAKIYREAVFYLVKDGEDSVGVFGTYQEGAISQLWPYFDPLTKPEVGKKVVTCINNFARSHNYGAIFIALDSRHPTEMHRFFRSQGFEPVQREGEITEPGGMTTLYNLTPK